MHGNHPQQYMKTTIATLKSNGDDISDVGSFKLLTCLSLCNTHARAVNLTHAVLCDDEGVTLAVSLWNTQAHAVNLIPAILCNDGGVIQARGC